MTNISNKCCSKLYWECVESCFFNIISTEHYLCCQAEERGYRRNIGKAIEQNVHWDKENIFLPTGKVSIRISVVQAQYKDFME